MKNTVLKAFLITACLIMMLCLLCGCNDVIRPGGDNNPDGYIPQSCNHQYGEWTTEDTDPKIKCEDRTYTAVCSLCQKTETRKGTYADHTITQVVKEPTCGEDGYVMEECTSCEYAKTKETLYATGEHSKFNEIPIFSTCSREGYIISICDTCGWSEIFTTLPKADHVCEGYDFDKDTHYQVCTVCKDKTNITPHSYDDGQCTVCGVYEEYYEISMWVQNGYIAIPLFTEQIQEFADANRITIKLEISEVDSSVGGSNIMSDPASAPDIFCFTQRELQGLIDAEAIIPLHSEADEIIRADHCQGAVLAASQNGIIYGYPLAIFERTSIMFYDKSLISDSDAKSLEKIIDICEENNKYLRFSVSNGWGVSYFFMGTGCKSNWSVNKNWEITGLDDNYNSEMGIVAMKALANLVNSSAFNDESYFVGNNNDTAVIISELGSRWTAENLFGENLGVAPLPYFTVDGESYQLRSYSNTIMLGISPTEDTKKAELLSRLALWLSGEECQTERYDSFHWCPTNLSVQASDEVQSDVYFPAQIEQYNVSTPEIFKKLEWWYLAEDLYKAAKEAKTDEDFQLALDQYTEALNKPTEEETKLDCWSVIGGIMGTVWDVDFPMTEVAQNTFESEPMALNQYEELKCRFEQSWDINYGGDGIIGGINFVVEESGTYVVRLVLHDDNTATITLIPA